MLIQNMKLFAAQSFAPRAVADQHRTDSSVRHHRHHPSVHCALLFTKDRSCPDRSARFGTFHRSKYVSNRCSKMLRVPINPCLTPRQVSTYTCGWPSSRCTAPSAACSPTPKSLASLTATRRDIPFTRVCNLLSKNTKNTLENISKISLLGQPSGWFYAWLAEANSLIRNCFRSSSIRMSRL